MKHYGLEMNLNFSTELIEQNIEVHNGKIPEKDHDMFWVIYSNIEAEIKSKINNEENFYLLLYLMYTMNPYYIYVVLRLLTCDKHHIRSDYYAFCNDLINEMTDSILNIRIFYSSSNSGEIGGTIPNRVI